MEDQFWKLSCQADKQRRAATKRDGRNRYSIRQTSNFLLSMFSDIGCEIVDKSGAAIPDERIERASVRSF